jgi:hypothetical protein
MKDISAQVQLIQCHIAILQALITCGELVEYDANWLPNAKKVVRDKSGRFASRAAQIKEDATALAQTGGQLLDISADAISNMVKDPGFRERAGLQTSAMMGKAIGNLVAQAKIFPGLEKEIDKLIKEQEKKLTDIYGKDNDALNQAFRKTKLPQPPKDASFKDKLEFQVARYKAYEDTLKNPQHRTTLDDVAAVGKAAVPVAAGIGLNLAVDLAVPLLLGNPLSLGALAAVSVASYAASELASFGTKKLLDKTGLSDTQKVIADIAVRILAGAAVSGAASKVAGNIAAKEAEKKSAEEAALAKKAAEKKVANAALALASSRRYRKAVARHNAKTIEWNRSNPTKPPGFIDNLDIEAILRYEKGLEDRLKSSGISIADYEKGLEELLSSPTRSREDYEKGLEEILKSATRSKET